MSDAITLDVADTTPVRLDVGDADPIAREEIAELDERVTTVEGDVSALDGRMDAAEGDISTLGTTVDGIDERVEAIEADYVTSEDVMGALGGEAPALVSGSSRAMLGDAETASWMGRTTAADGAALIESVKGNTIVQDGSLLPVRIEGVETVGFNQFDKNNLNRINGYIENGSIISNPNHVIVYIPCLPNTTYCASRRAVSINERFTIGWTAEPPAAGVSVYGVSSASTSQVVGNNMVLTTTTGADARYIVMWTWADLASVALELLCINISDPARNGTYEPYWRSERAIPASTYFPDGMRSAGSVSDELRADAAVTRVGAVQVTGGASSTIAQSVDGTCINALVLIPNYDSTTGGGISSDQFTETSAGWRTVGLYEVRNAGASGGVFIGLPLDVSTQAQVNAWLAEHKPTFWYELTTPTTTPIDPPLPMSYRTGAGGTERVMVASGTTSAPPVFATRYPLDPADLAASIAPRESATAEANHAVGDLIMLGWTLCKVTTAIARGEAITIGTNVTKTSVAAEIAALS